MTTPIRIQATIPDGVQFEDLQLGRDARDGSVIFNTAPIRAICEASGFDFEEFVHGDDDKISGLIVAWYQVHLHSGGKPDPVQEDLLEETRLQEQRGGGFAYPPGHA